MELQPYDSTLERIWHYAFMVICGLIFFFLIFPILVIIPLSFNATDFFTFTPEMLAFKPKRLFLQALPGTFSPMPTGSKRCGIRF